MPGIREALHRDPVRVPLSPADQTQHLDTDEERDKVHLVVIRRHGSQRVDTRIYGVAIGRKDPSYLGRHGIRRPLVATRWQERKQRGCCGNDELHGAIITASMYGLYSRQ